MRGIIPRPILKSQPKSLEILDPVEVPTPPRKLLDLVRDAIRVKHYSCQTEKSYVH